jgi:hypothetical protein
MPLDAFLYLAEVYWPFLAGAALVGLVTGWLSYEARPK